MSFYKLGTDDPFQDYTLTSQIDSVAYVMCAPVVKNDVHPEYILLIDTEKRGVQELKFDVQQNAKPSSAETDSTRGNHFVVTLKFKKGRAVVSDVKVADWENGGFGIGNLDDIDN